MKASKRFYSLQLLCILFLMATVANGAGMNTARENEDLAEFLAPVQAAADRLQSFSSDFIQERELELFTKPVIFHGRLTVVRPDHLRWEFTSPSPSVLIFSGVGGIRCDGTGSAAHFSFDQDPIMSAVADQLWLWLGGDYTRLAAAYTMARKGEDQLQLVPQLPAMAEYIERVELTFDLSTYQPKLVSIIEPGGDSTRIRFLSWEMNPVLPETVFSRCEP